MLARMKQCRNDSLSLEDTVPEEVATKATVTPD